MVALSMTGDSSKAPRLFASVLIRRGFPFSQRQELAFFWNGAAPPWFLTMPPEEIQQERKDAPGQGCSRIPAKHKLALLPADSEPMGGNPRPYLASRFAGFRCPNYLSRLARLAQNRTAHIVVAAAPSSAGP
jgi:hypothetical protein